MSPALLISAEGKPVGRSGLASVRRTIFEELSGRGYCAGHDVVRRYAGALLPRTAACFSAFGAPTRHIEPNRPNGVPVSLQKFPDPACMIFGNPDFIIYARASKAAGLEKVMMTSCWQYIQQA
jgi:hypothetical protein